MKTNKKYTKRQILESIKYWKKQLKTGNYKKLNESEYDEDYEFCLYGEMNHQGSYCGLEHWWLVVSDEYSNTLKQYIEAIEIIISNFESEYSYAYIDPKTKKIVDSDGLDYNYLAKQIYDNDEVLIQCSSAYEHDELDLKNMTQNDFKHNIIKIHWPDYNEFKYCDYDGAVTKI